MTHKVLLLTVQVILSLVTCHVTFPPYLIIKFTSCYSLSLRVTCLTIISNTDMHTYLSKGLQYFVYNQLLQ